MRRIILRGGGCIINGGIVSHLPPFFQFDTPPSITEQILTNAFRIQHGSGEQTLKAPNTRRFVRNIEGFETHLFVLGLTSTSREGGGFFGGR
jgi:hypothetical protein